MDRLFILQSSYVNSRHNPDGLIYKHLLSRYKLQNLDDICETENVVSNTAFETARKRNWKIIPVGTVEFVQEWLYMMNPDAYMIPIEIPKEIWYLADREYSIMKGREIPKEKKTEEYFIKDADHLKRWNNLLYFDENEGMGYVITITGNGNTSREIKKALRFRAEAGAYSAPGLRLLRRYHHRQYRHSRGELCGGRQRDVYLSRQ